MSPLSTFEKTNLDRQGFDFLDDEAKRLYALPLRFTPFVATVGVVIGLILHSSLWLAAMTLIALSGVLLPRGMLIDVAYNLGVRHLFRAAPLPSTPTPRRFSYLVSTSLLTGSALSFYLGAPLAGYVLGGLVAIGGATLTITLWCLGSWTWALVLNGVAALSPSRSPRSVEGGDSGNAASDRAPRTSLTNASPAVTSTSGTLTHATRVLPSTPRR